MASSWKTWGSESRSRAIVPRRQAVTPSNESAVPSEITQEMIAKRAFEIWQRKGRPTDMDTQNWIEAEAELREQQA